MKNFVENKKQVWKIVNKVRKRVSHRAVSIRDSMDEELTREDDTAVRWREYFVQLQIVKKISEVGGDGRKEGLERMRG